MKLWLSALLLISSSTQAATQWLELPLNVSVSSSYNSRFLGTYSYDVACMYFKVTPMVITHWNSIGFCEGNLCNEYHDPTGNQAYFGPFVRPTSISLLKSNSAATSFNLSSVILGVDESGRCGPPPFTPVRDATPFKLASHTFISNGQQYQLVREATSRCSNRNEGAFALDQNGRKIDLAGCILEDPVALSFQGRPLIFGRLASDMTLVFRDFQTNWTTLEAKVTEFIPVVQGSKLTVFGLNPGQSVIMLNFSYKIWNSLSLVCQSNLSVATNGQDGYLVSCTTPEGNEQTIEVR